MVAPDIIQLRHARPEIGRGRVVGVIPEARILPKTVSRHRLTFVPPAQATEPCDMAIADPLAGQGIGKRIGIELRVRPLRGMERTSTMKSAPTPRSRRTSSVTDRVEWPMV